MNEEAEEVSFFAVKADADRLIDIVITMHNAGPGTVVEAFASVVNLDSRPEWDHANVQFGEIAEGKSVVKVAKLKGAADVVSFSASFSDGKLWMGGGEMRNKRRIRLVVPGPE